MQRFRPHLDHPAAARAIYGAAALTLAAGPVVWLVETWRDPSYASDGFAVFAICLSLFAWSVSSRRVAGPGSGRRLAIGLLMVSGAVRLAGQVFAVHLIGALTLVLDVYALGLLFNLGRRTRAISPAWLAVCFAFSLPLERAVQRIIGYGLQQISADGACGMLKLWSANVSCEGVRIVLDGRDVLVDLPCSGARTMLLLLLAFSIAACLTRPGARAAAAGAVLTLIAALTANALRISVLATGIAHPQSFGGADVMNQPWHDLIGLAALALGALPLVVWTRVVLNAKPGVTQERAGQPHQCPAPLAFPRVRLAASLAALAIAAVIVTLPRKPLDVSAANVAIELPTSLDGYGAEPAALSPRERAFFTQYGGAAAKAAYGPHNLLVIRTSSPLRHLHEPDECLRGLGFRAVYLGSRFSPVPSAVYRATAPDGRSYRVDVSFVSNKGHITSNVATAVWHWLHRRDTVWTAVQRISPESLPEAQHEQWARAVLAALDLTPAGAYGQCHAGGCADRASCRARTHTGIVCGAGRENRHRRAARSEGADLRGKLRNRRLQPDRQRRAAQRRGDRDRLPASERQRRNHLQG